MSTAFLKSNNSISEAGSPLLAYPLEALRVGVLALQGDFAKHAEAVRRLGASTVLLRRAEQFEAIDALVLPGGESTTLLRLLNNELRTCIQGKISSGLPTLATCAGAILLAQEVRNPSQESLACVDIVIARNDYGRQLDSFRTSALETTAAGRTMLGVERLEGIFIRAPRIISCQDSVEVLATLDGYPVLVRQNAVLVASFHPELSQGESKVHELLLQMAAQHCAPGRASA